MEKKSFLIEEIKDVVFDIEKTNEWKELAEKIGASGQIELLGNGEKQTSMLPFPVMTEAEATIYKEIFNQKENYKKFRGQAIPIEGLSLIALSEKEEYFDKIEVWWSTDNPDPIIVGKKYRDESDKKSGYDWRMLNYWIFQWGAKLKPLGELLELYDKKIMSEIEEDYNHKKRDHARNMEKFRFQIASFQ